MINRFHDWEGPNFAGSLDQRIESLNKVLPRVYQRPRPAWSTVGSIGRPCGDSADRARTGEDLRLHDAFESPARSGDPMAHARRFNLLNLLLFAGRGLRRRWWLVLAALLAWIAADIPLYQSMAFELEIGAFAMRRSVAAVSTATMMAAIIDGARDESPGFGPMVAGLARAMPTVALAEAALWSPILALKLFGVDITTPSPLIIALIALFLTTLALWAPLVVPAAVDGGRSPWAAMKTNLTLRSRRRWLMLGLTVLLIAMMTVLGGSVEATLPLIGVEWEIRPMLAFYLVFALAAIMQAAAYIEFSQASPGARAEQVAETFD